MTSDQQDTVPKSDVDADRTGEPQHAGSQHAGSQHDRPFNALDVLARLPDLSRDQPANHSRSSRRHRKRPREISLRLLGGSVIVLFLLAVTVQYFRSGSGEDASLPDEAAASFEVDSAGTSPAKETRLGMPTITPIADTDTSPNTDASPKPSANPVGPLDASEFEKALGVVKTESTRDDATVAAIQPFVVGGQDNTERPLAPHKSTTPTRPFAPRFEETPGTLAGTQHGTSQQPNPGAGSDPRSPYAAPQAPAVESANFTPWQPNMAATRERAYSGPSQTPSRSNAGPSYSPPSYSPWSAGTVPAPSSPGPARREPAYTAMNPNPSGTSAGVPSGAPVGPTYTNPSAPYGATNHNPPHAPSRAPGGQAYENPSPVWIPGNPYAAPNSAQNNAPGDVSGIHNPYQQ